MIHFKYLSTEGALRVDANVSITDANQLGTRTEIKNLGSVRAVQLAVDYEINRQLNMVKNGKKIINETRGWDSVTNKTMSMRDKEVLQVIKIVIVGTIKLVNFTFYFRTIVLCQNLIYYLLI